MNYIFPILISSILYSYIFCGLCGLNPPEDRSYCGNYLSSDGNSKCSYCQEKATGKYYCLVQTNNENIDGFNCDTSSIPTDSDLPGAPCKDNEEIKKVQEAGNLNETYCHEHSVDEKHPCCYFDDGVNQRCFSIGEITSMTLYTYNDFLNCLSTYINIKIYWLFIFLIFYLY